MDRFNIFSDIDVERLFLFSKIDFSKQNDGFFHVDSFETDLWVRYSDEDKIIFLSTYCPISISACEGDLLYLVNRCNQIVSFAQICLSPDRERLNGFYQINCAAGVDSFLLLHTMSSFAAAFSKAIDVMNAYLPLGEEFAVEKDTAERKNH